MQKRPFLDQNHGLPPLENCQFFDLLNFMFLQPRKAFFALEYRNIHFPGLYCPKIKLGKLAIFGPKQWVNPFGKMSIFRLFELLVFIAQKGVFSIQNIVKDIFLCLYFLKKKFEKMAIFGPKPCVNPFGKMSIFPLFELLVSLSQKGFFPLQNMVKDIFLAYIA